MWKVVGASVQGSGHERSGQPCQDAHYWQVLDKDVLVAAVADGAGSASLSDLGAETAVKAAVERLIQYGDLVDLAKGDDWAAFTREVHQAAKLAVQTEADARQLSIRELASTLLVLLSTPSHSAVMQIGDGAVVGRNYHNRLFTMTKPTRSEYVNETVFLVSPTAETLIQQNCFLDVCQIALFSDGLQMVALEMPQAKPYQPFFAKMFDFAASTEDEADGKQQLVDFLQSPRLRGRTDDDITLLLATYVNPDIADTLEETEQPESMFTSSPQDTDREQEDCYG
jgi:hypothetical protein